MSELAVFGSQLTERVAAAIAEWYARFRAAHGPAYAVAVFSDDGAMTICPAANTDPAVPTDPDPADPAPITGDPDELDRWYVGEWPERIADGEAFAAICASLREALERFAFAELRPVVYEGMVEGLARARDHGAFGEPQPILFASISDSADATDLERASAIRLNADPSELLDALGDA